MTAQLLPVDSARAARRFQVTLQGAGVYRFRFHWLSRLDAWFWDLESANGTPILAGLRLAVDTDLLRPHQAIAGVPPGALVCVNRVHPGHDPGRNDLGTACRVLYIPLE